MKPSDYLYDGIQILAFFWIVVLYKILGRADHPFSHGFRLWSNHLLWDSWWIAKKVSITNDADQCLFLSHISLLEQFFSLHSWYFEIGTSVFSCVQFHVYEKLSWCNLCTKGLETPVILALMIHTIYISPRDLMIQPSLQHFLAAWDRYQLSRTPPFLYILLSRNNNYNCAVFPLVQIVSLHCQGNW